MTAEAVVGAVLVAAAAYAAAGLLFALVFLARGVEKVDPAAAGSSVGFRLIVLPGVVALWPLFASRWWRGANAPPTETNAHRRAAGGARGAGR